MRQAEWQGLRKKGQSDSRGNRQERKNEKGEEAEDR